MDNDKLLKQAHYLLKKVLKHRSPGWPTCPQEEDLLTQEIELYLNQFKPDEKKPNKYKQGDIIDQINQMLNK
jgi:hypothetical protein